MKAKDIMRRRVLTATPDMTLRELAGLLDDNHISGAPVLGPGKTLMGVVSQSDLVHHDRETPQLGLPTAPQGQDDELRSRGLHAETPDYTRVEEVMTPWVVSLEEDTPIEEVARQMLAKRIHRVVVTREGKLAGIISSMDVIRALLAMRPGGR